MHVEFMKFLKEYGVIGLAIGVIIGSKAGELVKAIVDGLLMPIVGLLLPSGDWQKLVIGPFQIGLVLAALVNFVIIAMLVFWFAKKVLREEQVAKK
ncbi:MAG: MscL family protein [Gemmatimonadota bacterium]